MAAIWLAAAFARLVTFAPAAVAAFTDAWRAAVSKAAAFREFWRVTLRAAVAVLFRVARSRACVPCSVCRLVLPACRWLSSAEVFVAAAAAAAAAFVAAALVRLV